MEPNLSREEDADKHVRILARVVTTSGAYPAGAPKKVNGGEKVSQFLDEAAHHLHLTDTSGWVATTGDGREINVDATFSDNGLHDEVTLQWGPRVGGGG